MKNFRRKGLLSAVLAAAGVVVIWWLWPRESSRDLPEHRQVAVQKTMTMGSPEAKEAARKPPPELGMEEFKKFILERSAKWMESRGRDAASLVAMWDLAGDESLLEEAAKNFPNDPRVCVAMIGHVNGKGGDALPWAERLIAAEPANPSGHYWKALLLAYTAKPEDAVEALRSATKIQGKPDAHLRDRIITVREAALAGGGSIKEAAAALYGPFSKMGTPMINGKMISVLRKEIEAAKSAGNENRVTELAALGAAAAEHLRFTSAPTMNEELVGQGMLQMVLKELPADTEYGNDGRTAGSRLTEIEAERAAVQKLFQPGNIEGNFMNSLTEAQASEYTDRVILHGELSARKWLNELLSKGAVKPQ